MCDSRQVLIIFVPSIVIFFFFFRCMLIFSNPGGFSPSLLEMLFFVSVLQQLPPHVRVWDSVTLNTLHVIGMGFFDRAVTCIAFSKSVSKVNE